MHVLIIGAAGMVGRKLANRLLADGALNDRAITKLTAVDVVAPDLAAVHGVEMDQWAVDISDSNAADKLIDGRPDIIFHLAAIVSGEAETDFDKGYRINLDATYRLLEAIRAAADYHPRIVFTSSIAVFGAPFHEKIEDEFFHTPLTSYGTQKAISELLLSDYTRKGIIDAIGIRLPTIVIRPGKPNLAASGFFSNILREPLVGQEAVLPVSDQVRHWLASPRAAVGFLIHAAGLDGEKVGNRRNLTMPGISITVAEMIDALGRIAGQKAVDLIRREPHPLIERIVAGWPRDFAPNRALELGFTADPSMDAIIHIHIEDELAGRIGSA